MAKRTGRKGRRLNATAETIGFTLGRIAARIDAWKRHRKEIAAEIQGVVNRAQTMLRDIGHEPAPAGKGGRPKRFTMSAAARRKISLAAKRRWAERRAAEGKKRR